MTVFALMFALAAGPAHADPPADDAKAKVEAAEAPADDAKVENCAELEGDAKAACDERVKEAAAKKKAAEAEAPAAGKGGKAQRSNNNRMESEFTDE